MKDRFANIKTINSGHTPRWQKIGTISSVPVSKENRFGPAGVYELDIEIDMAALELEGDKMGYVRHTIARHLAGCAATTGIPANEKAWLVEIDSPFRLLFPSLPKEFRA